MREYKKILILALGILLITGLDSCSLKEKEVVVPTVSEVVYSDTGYQVAFSELSGAYEEEFALQVSCEEDKNCIVYYTTDGSDPTTSDTRREYTEEIQITDREGDKNVVSAVDPAEFDAAYAYAFDGIYLDAVKAPSDDAVDKCTVIRATAKLSDDTYTQIASETYFVGSITEHIQGIQESCEAAGTSLAIVSISMEYDDLFDDDTGIYVRGSIFDNVVEEMIANGEQLSSDARAIDANYKQRGREWERNASVTLLESDGTSTICALSQNCGIRVQGNYSRSDLQKGFRLYARNEYGDNNFSYPVFGEELTNDQGECMDHFKTLVLRNGGNCAFTTKYSDTYWQSLVTELDCDTQASRPCIVYLNGEYWGLYILQEDYSDDYFEDTHGVNKDDVVLYKGDAETYEIGYKLDVGDLPQGVTDESYYFQELMEFFDTHNNLESEEDYEAFSKLVDVESVLDYYAVEIWINNKWDWPGKNWSMWKTISIDDSNEYADGRWRFCFYDMEFGGVSGASDATTNTIKEDNYKPDGMLDYNTTNPAVLCFVYLMSNQEFRGAYIDRLNELSNDYFNMDLAMERLDQFKNVYTPLYEQFFERYDNVGSVENSNEGGYASYRCIYDFLQKRESYIPKLIEYIQEFYGE